MKRYLVFGLLAGLIGLTSVAFAQGRTVNTTIEGDGRFKLGRNSFDVNRATLVLRESGRMEFVVYGDRTVRFEGRYRTTSNDQVRLSVETVIGDSADGTITVNLDSRFRLRSASGSGTTELGGWSVNFDTRSNDDNWGGGNRPGGGSGNVMDQTRAGRGSFTRGSTTRDVYNASVRLMRNGVAEINFSGTLSWTLRGRWVDGGSKGFRVDVTDGLGSSGTSGVGYVMHEGDRLTGLRLSGTEGAGKSWRLDFEATGSGGSGGSSNPDQGWSASWANITETRNGHGELRSETSQAFWMNKAYVNFTDDGKFQIAIYGERTYRFAGTWRQSSPDTADLRITSGYGAIFGIGEASGSGKIWFRGRRLSSFEFKTKSAGIDRTISFRAD